MNQLSHLYRTIGKTIDLTIWTFVGKVTSLLFNTLPSLSDFQVAQMVKVSTDNEGDPGSIPGSGRSAAEGNGNPL